MGGSRKFERAILVGNSFAHGENGMDSRVRDLTPWEDKNWKRYETGGGQAYLTFLEQEIIPFVEKKLSSSPQQTGFIRPVAWRIFWGLGYVATT